MCIAHPSRYNGIVSTLKQRRCQNVESTLKQHLKTSTQIIRAKLYWTSLSFSEQFCTSCWGYQFSEVATLPMETTTLVSLIPCGNSVIVVLCQPYGISNLLSHTLWKYGNSTNPQSKTPWNFRILRFNTPWKFHYPQQGGVFPEKRFVKPL